MNVSSRLPALAILLACASTGLGGASGPAANKARIPAPLKTVSFEQYETTEQLVKDCTNWDCVEQENSKHISLDRKVAPPGGTRSMRYRYFHTGDGCNSITVKRAITFPRQQEVWAQFQVRWSKNFRTTNAKCYPNDHKLIFGDTERDDTGRWAVYVGADLGPKHNIQIERPFGSDGFEGAKYLNGEEVFPSELWDGEWHTIRIHLRNSTTGKSKDAAFRLWVDGKPLHDEKGFNTSTRDGKREFINGFSFAHNKDDGPANEEMFLWWGKIVVYNEDPGW